MVKENLHTPKKSYTGRVIEKVKGLETGSVVIIDIEGTALSSTSKSKVRKDFDEVYHWIKENRPDIKIGTITYRGQKTGINELEEYHFYGNWYKEDVVESMGKPDRIGFLKRIFGEKPTKLLLIDDSPDGQTAESEGFGIKADQ